MQSSINRSAFGGIAYTVDGREVSRAEAAKAWQARDTGKHSQGSLLILDRAEDRDVMGRYARECLARHGIGIYHLEPGAAVAHANGARLDTIIDMASAATAPTATQVRP